MTKDEAITALRGLWIVKKECAGHDGCEGCLFENEASHGIRCSLNYFPDDWELPAIPAPSAGGCGFVD